MLQGAYRRADGCTFRGDFNDGRKVRGVWDRYKYPNKDAYTGRWQAGIDRSETKTCHPGESRDGRRLGQGSYNFYASGDWFVGDFKDNLMNITRFIKINILINI